MFLCFDISGLVIAIVSTVLIWREVRARNNARMLAMLHAAREGGGDHARRASDDFHDQVWLPLCQLIGGHALRLNYSLSHVERRRIWRSRSPLILEVLLREIETANSGDALGKAISQLPPGMDRPDPTGWCDTSVPSAN